MKNVRVAQGWSADDYEDYFEKAILEASDIFYNNKRMCFGEGGSIPLMSQLNELWPKRQFLITGVLGPFSNAHGPN